MKNTILLFLLSATLLCAQQVYTTFDVEAKQHSDLTLTTTGVINHVYVDIGDRVKEGDILLTLDNDDLKLAIDLAKADLELADVNHRFAEKTYERYLKVKDVIDDDQFEQYLLAYEKSIASLNASKANLAYKKALFEKSILRAPFSGVIAKRHKELGDGVSGAMIEPVITLVSAPEVKLVFSFDEKYWQKIKVGSPVSYRVDGNDKLFHGKISKVYPTVDAKTRKAFAELYTKSFMPGLFGEGTIEVE
jgi:RND family efflux transporter MFP subunit